LIAPPLLRLALALPFLRSGRTRWDGFLSLSPATLYLFENQFKVHLFGAAYAFPAPDTVALLVAVAEIALPSLLILGLATRLTALALLVMTGVIQLVFPDGWANFHLYWASLAVGIMAIGPGALSLDQLIERWSYRRSP
jgi:putative oxidoreductase